MSRWTACSQPSDGFTSDVPDGGLIHALNPARRCTACDSRKQRTGRDLRRFIPAPVRWYTEMDIFGRGEIGLHSSQAARLAPRRDQDAALAIRGPHSGRYLLRELQSGQVVEPPKSKPMPSIGSRVHELRMKHSKNEFRIIYRIDADAIVILEAFQKKSQKTPKKVIDACKQRLKAYDELADS